MYNVERSFLVNAGVLSMTNGSCPWVMDPGNATHSLITTGDCKDPRGKWAFRDAVPNVVNGDGNVTGTIVWTGASDLGVSPGGELCLDGGVTLTPCSNSSTVWTLNTTAGPSAGYLSTQGRAGPSCLAITPDNSNNTLAAATTVVNRNTGQVAPSSRSAAPANATEPADGWTYTLSLDSGVEFTIITAVLTLRDIGCAGTRSTTVACPSGPLQDVAVQHAGALANTAALTAAEAAHEGFWERYWNASSLDLTGGLSTAHPNASRLEKWYYGMQYSFGTNSRQGKVAPSLSGVLVTMDPVPWKDQLTIDYNVRA